MLRSQVIKPRPIGDRVREVLLERILSGAYPPGFRLIEPRIARELGISLAPLREALGGLEAAGLVQSEPYRGTRVREMSEAEIVETLELKGALEEFSARLAGPVLKRTSQNLRAQNAAMIAAGRAGDRRRTASLHIAFHRSIVVSSGNSVLLRVWDSLVLGVSMWMRMHVDRFDYRQLAGEHVPIIHAFERGSGSHAGKLLRAHCLAVSEQLTEH